MANLRDIAQAKGIEIKKKSPTLSPIESSKPLAMRIQTYNKVPTNLQQTDNKPATELESKLSQGEARMKPELFQRRRAWLEPEETSHKVDTINTHSDSKSATEPRTD